MAKLKGQKTNKGTAPPTTQRREYAREPAAEEYQTFPPGFRLEHGTWPVQRVIDQRYNKKKNLEYLVEWKAHPLNGLPFEPSWVGYYDVTYAVRVDWEQRQNISRPEIASPGTTREGSESISNPSPSVATQHPVESNLRIIKRLLAPSTTDDGQSEHDSEQGRKDAAKRQKIRHIVPSSSREAKRRQHSETSYQVRKQPRYDSPPVDLSSPPPEIQDSQVPVRILSVAVEVPPPPTDKSSYETIPTSSFSPVDSAVDFASPKRLHTRLEALLSSEVQTLADYPSLPLEQTQNSQSRADSVSSALFFSDSPPSPIDQRVEDFLPGSEQEIPVQQISPPARSSEQTSQADSTPNVGIASEFSIQVGASGTPPTQSPTPQSPLLSAQQRSNIAISPVNETQSSSEESSSREGVFRKPAKLAQQPKRRLFLPLPSDAVLEIPRTSSVQTHRIIKGPLAAMATPSQKSSPTLHRVSTPLKPARSPAPTLQEQLSQSRASRRGNGLSTSPQEPTNPPTAPPIREPTPVALGRDAGQSPSQASGINESPIKATIGKKPKEEDVSSVMQLDEPAPSQSPDGANHSTVPARVHPQAPLQIQQSIERDDSERDMGTSTQASVNAESSQSTESGTRGLLVNTTPVPNYPILGPAEYVVPLHAEGKTQEAYNDAIKCKQRALLRFVRRRSSTSTPSSSGSATSSTDATDMTDLVDRLDGTITLLDLGYEGMLTQTSYNEKHLATWAAQASSKFGFLERLVMELESKDCSIVIFAKPGPTQHVLENFFSALNVEYRTYSAKETFHKAATRAGLLTIHLVPTGQRVSIDTIKQPSLIIALDSSFDSQDSLVDSLRNRPDETQVPIVHLLVVNSSEHVERCLPRNMPSPQRNRLLMQTIFQARASMGLIYKAITLDAADEYCMQIYGTSIGGVDMQAQQKVYQKIPERHLKTLAKKVAHAVLGDSFEDSWTIPSIPILELAELELSQPLRLPSPSPISPVATPSNRKRVLDGESFDTAGHSKRQRLTPLPNATYTNDPSGEPSSHLQDLQRTLKAVQEDLIAERTARATAEEERERTRTQLNEWKQSLSELQRRYEHRSKEFHENRGKIKRLEREAEFNKERQDKDTAARDTLKTQLSQMREELATARADLKAVGGDIAALEQAREEARTMTSKFADSEKKLDSLRKDFDFMRSQYQDASARAVDNAREVGNLQEEAAALRKTASDERRRLKELNYQESIKAHLARIQHVEAEKRQLEVMLRKLDEENKILKKNRGVTTRASSVQPQPPGSPRSKSRGGSPVPGSLAAVTAMHTGNRASALRHER